LHHWRQQTQGGGRTGTCLGLIARQPAPAQITYLDYPNTTGLTPMHDRLTDAVADPPGEPVRHSEELVRLPGSFCCYQPRTDAPAITPLPAQSAVFVTFEPLVKGFLSDYLAREASRRG
jgi:protein O-GlcNAc transferase